MYAHEVSPPRSLTSSHWPVGESPVMHIVIMHPHALALFRPGPHPPRPPRPPLSVPCAPASRHRNPLHHISRGKTINAMCSRCTVKAERRLANLEMSHQAEVAKVEAEIEALEEQNEQLKRYNIELR